MRVEEIFRRISKGLLTLLPFMILIWLFSFLYRLLAGIFFYLFGITDNNLIATLFIVICSLSLLFYVGYLVERNRELLLLKFTELVIERIPVVKGIYTTVKDLVKTFSGGGKGSYLGVAYIRFGNTKVLGFITKEEAEDYWIFVPTTPNPTSGLLLKVKKEDIEVADIGISEGMKKIISLGVK